MSRVLLIGFSEVSARLPEVLAGRGLQLVALGSALSPFRHSRWIDRFVTVPQPDTLEGWIRALLEDPSLVAGPRDWVLHSGDGLPRALARLPLPPERLLPLLPIRRAGALEMVGSKAGLAALLERQAIPTPRTRVVSAPEALPEALEDWSGPLMLKGDSAGGGREVRRCAGPAEVLAAPPPRSWYPLVVQRWVAGTDLSVEALFDQGALLGLQASIPLACTDFHGPSHSRRFLPSAPPGVIDTLERLGPAAGLHGLFNCTLRLPADGSAALLFEADPRPNAWCAYGPGLGLDWGALMAAGAGGSGPRQPQRLPPRGQVVHLFPRAPEHALATLSWRVALPWLLALPGTWDRRPRHDRAIGAWEWQRLRRAPSLRPLARPLRSLALMLPEPVRRLAYRRDLDRRLLRCLGV